MSQDTHAAVALITGANRGLGFETARQLARQGVHVLLAGRDLAKTVRAADTLVAEALSVEPVKLDILLADDRNAVAALIRERFGRLDILVNNAGVWLESNSSSEPPAALASTLPESVLRATMDANFHAPVALTQALLPLIRKSVAGRIVNVSSIMGSLELHADPDSVVYKNKIFAYDTSKAALNSFTIHLAHELKDTTIKVNSIHPGWVRSEMGGASADLGLAEGCETAVRFAVLGDDGPSGGFFFKGQTIPW